MDWFKQHADTIVILGSFALGFSTLNEKINTLEKETAVIKTILVMKNIMPVELAISHDDPKIPSK
jgi:hypothetical protein